MTLHTPSRRRSPPALPVQPHRRHFPRRTVAPWRRQPQVVEGRSGRGRRVAARPRTATRAPNLSAGTASLLGARRASLGGSSPDSVRVREARGPTSARGYGDGDGVGDRPSARAVPSAPRRFPSAEPSRTSEDEESEEERGEFGPWSGSAWEGGGGGGRTARGGAARPAGAVPQGRGWAAPHRMAKGWAAGGPGLCRGSFPAIFS